MAEPRRAETPGLERGRPALLRCLAASDPGCPNGGQDNQGWIQLSQICLKQRPMSWYMGRIRADNCDGPSLAPRTGHDPKSVKRFSEKIMPKRELRSDGSDSTKLNQT